MECDRKWSCSACTYLNWSKSSRCTQCSTPRDSLPDIFSNLSLSSSSLPPPPPHSSSLDEIGASSPLITENLGGGASGNAHALSPPSSSAHKWACGVCTYDNWPRALKCVMCLAPKGGGKESSRISSPPPLSSISTNNRICRDADRRWLEACIGVVEGNISPVEIYLAAGGDPSRQLSQAEVSLLARPSAFDTGLTLIHLALRFQQENLLATLLSLIEGSPNIVKRVPSYAAPHLALTIRRHFMSILRQRKGNFRCYVLSEIATFTLPAEIEEYPSELQETLFDEVMDREVQKELDDSQIINWHSEVVDSLNSRLYALWNRSSGNCLLDSVLQATWAIFDSDNGLRQALADSLQDAANMFYQRWKDSELLHAHLLDFSLNESQCATDWAKLLSIASKPGSSLEQLHIFVLAHIFRRPILVYGVKVVKSFRGETLGYARYEGIYLPLFWEPSFCYKSPICLGYTRGHFSALVTIEPDCDPLSNSNSGTQISSPDINIRSSYLPLTSVDGNVLPIHFLTQAEIGKEEMIMNQWLDVRFIESGLMVARQSVQTPPLLVGQMVEEWLNHYRCIGQLSNDGRGRYFRAAPPTCYSSEGESDD